MQTPKHKRAVLPARLALLVLCAIVSAEARAQEGAPKDSFRWSELAAIPDKHGFAGSFAGISGGSLLVAGGANFPDGGAPWTGSKKAWTDRIFILERPTGNWKEAGKLPHNLGYGVSATWNDKIICVGGSNESGHTNEVITLSYAKGHVTIGKLPDLPKPLANSSGAIVGDILYVAGGLISSDDKRCATVFWALDLSLPTSKQRWTAPGTWPGPERMLAVAGALGKSFYLFSGAKLVDAANGTTKREYLRDAYCFTPGKGWKKLSQMPLAVVAAPGPAYASGSNTLTIFGGDDGELAEQAAQLKEKHPGFSVQISTYNAKNNTWLVSGNIPVTKKTSSGTDPNASIWAPVTTNSVLWNGVIVFPGGEVRPAVRTPRVRMVTLSK